MLTADLLRATLRQGEVRPAWLPVEGEAGARARERAAAVIAAFQAAVGQRRAALDEALDELAAGRPDFKVERGFAKLLLDRSTFSGASSEEATARRRLVFELAARARAAGSWDRAAVLAEAGAALGQEPAALDLGLYADLKQEERLVSWEPLEPAQLVERYNLALAQAVLLRALELEVSVRGADPPRLRQLLRQVKFQGLLQAAVRDGDEVRLRLDGPLSLFGATPRYGVRLAGFLPTLLLCPEWRLEAQVQFGRGRHRRRFRLGPEAGLVSTARDAGAWRPELVEAFPRRFREVAPEWRIDEEVPLLNLGGEVVVPDYRFVHEPSGWEGWLEVLGYWRRGGVARRLEALREHGQHRLVLALERGLRLGEGGLPAGAVVEFRELPDARKVLRALEDLRAADPSRPSGSGKTQARPKRRRKRAKRS